MIINFLFFYRRFTDLLLNRMATEVTPINTTTITDAVVDDAPSVKKVTHLQPATLALTVKDIGAIISTNLPKIRTDHKGSWVRYEKGFHQWKIVAFPDSIQPIVDELVGAEKAQIDLHGSRQQAKPRGPQKITITLHERDGVDGLTGLLISRRKQLVEDFPAGCTMWFDNDERLWKLQGYREDALELAKNKFLDLEAECIEHMMQNRKRHPPKPRRRQQGEAPLATTNTTGAA